MNILLQRMSTVETELRHVVADLARESKERAQDRAESRVEAAALDARLAEQEDILKQFRVVVKVAAWVVGALGITGIIEVARYLGGKNK